MRGAWLAVGLFTLITPACATSTPALRDAGIIANREHQARHLPGLAVAIFEGDEPFFAGAYGAADPGGAVPVTPETSFQLGSIAKQFLAALVVALSGEGAIALDAPARRYLSDFPRLTPDIHVRHLLNHTSGIRELFTLPEAQEGFDNLSRTREELVAAIKQAPVDFAAGSRWSYSNTNYTMLALIVERVTGRPYEDVLTERFFKPHRLASIRQCPSVQTTAGEARGHEWRNGANVPAAPENMHWIRGDGGLCGHALDLARWTRLLHTGRIVAADQWTAMTTPTRLADGSEAEYGFALSLVRPDGVRKIAHNGAMRGFSASAAYYPDTGTTVVVLVNRGDVRTEAIERALARRVIGAPEPDRTAQPIGPATRQRIAGTYNIGVFDVEVADRAGQLWFEMPPPGPSFRMRHIGGGRFVNDLDVDANGVELDARGQLVLYMGGMNWYGNRVIVRP
jgi:D-alanyl-D-alanine carboxypeptidase